MISDFSFSIFLLFFLFIFLMFHRKIQLWNRRWTAEHGSNQWNSAQRAQLGHELRSGDDGYVRFVQLVGKSFSQQCNQICGMI